MNKSLAEKYNIILIILLFVIPLLAINGSYYFISIINNEFKKNEHERKAIQEVETLSSEADFNFEFSKSFKDFFEILKSDSEVDNNNSTFITNHLRQTANSVFANPFPDYKLYVFKINSKTQNTDMIFYKDDNIKGKKILCLAFEHLYRLNNKKNSKLKVNTNEKSAKTLLGDYTDLETIANEMRATPTFSNGMHKFSWFIWDYVINSNEDVYGAILISNEMGKYNEKSQLYALKNLKQRGNAIGAFIPLYKEFGEPIYQPPLDRSDTFKDWTNKLTIQEEKDIEKWLKNPLPQNVKLGKYTAYCHLGRGATHIAVILVNSLKPQKIPKWIIAVNILFCLVLALLLSCGIEFGKWIQISLRTRFTLSYLLASILPLSLLGVTAYGYLLQYMNTAIDQESTELQTALTSIDAEKLAIVKEYKSTFAKAIKDETFINLIKEKGINNTLVSDRIVEIFENNKSNKYLPLLGVKIIDEFGEGAFSKGRKPTDINASVIIDSFLSAQINILRKQLNNYRKEKLDPYKGEEEKDLANKGYKALLGRELFEDISRYQSVPIKRKNGNLCCYQLFDIIMIDGKPRYMLFITWDDKTLDDEIIKESIAKYTLKKLDHNFLAYKSKGDKIGFFGNSKVNLSTNIVKQLKEDVEKAAIGNKSYIDKNGNNIIAIRPSYNFNDTIFVGWIDKYNIILSIIKRRLLFITLTAISILILIICSIRSSSIFLKPVSILKRALDEVSMGNLRISLENAPKDELGLLSKEFSKMIEDLREKERLSKLISDQAIQAIQKENNELLNKTETFKGVALVSDIRNFTGMSEKYDPTEITALLNEHFAEMTKIISDNGGQIYKFIGDAIEAVFPEKNELEKSASERAFNAGSMMISKLTEINKKRKIKDLFTYKIGIGLCYGTMYSGTIGSIETRLDYAILGEPLKKAAKYEALSIQNPSFPLVIGEDIAKRIASLGYSLIKIKNNQKYSIYSLDNKYSTKNTELLRKEEKKPENTERKEKIKTFDNNIKSFSFSKSKFSEKQKILSLISFILIFFSLLILSGMIFVNYTINNNLKAESDKECSRLLEQLKSEEILKSSFETLCFKLYDELDKSFNSDTNDIPFKQKIEKIFSKYEKMGCPIPKYYCCKYDGKNLQEENICSKGFTLKTYTDMTNYASSVNNYRGFWDKAWNEKVIRRNLLRKFMGMDAREEIMRSIHYRRASIAMIDNEYMLIDTNKIFDKKQEKLLGFVLCGLPKKLENIDLINYYTQISGKSLLLAIKNENNWYFSNNFPDNERQFISEANDINIIKAKDYFIKKNILIDDKVCSIYAIKKDLLDNNNYNFRNYIIYFIIIILLISIIWTINNKIDLSKPSISIKLRIDILLSSILPIIAVSFLSYLYVNEDFNVKKIETRYKLNKLIDDIEEKEYYYNPLCKTILDKYSTSKDLKEKASIANRDINSKEKIINNLREEIKEKFFDAEYILKSKVNPHFDIREIDIIGKNNWVAGEVKRTWQSNYNKKTGLSELGRLLTEITRAVYFKNNNKEEKINAKRELIVEQVFKALNTIFGNMFTIKIINFPNNLITITAQYTTIGLYVSTIYSEEDPNDLKYVIYALIFFDNEFKPNVCSMRNDNIPFKDYIASGSIGEELYCFYSPNIYVGDYFFYTPENETIDNNYINKREDFKTIKELGLVSSWINSSYLPVSKDMDLYGKYLIEARQGNLITENVYAAITSEYATHKKAFSKLPIFGLVIFLSIIIICLIVQISIKDLLLPINRLIEGAKSVEIGNYKFRTEFYRSDELGALCDSFDKMMKGLEEKQLMNRMVSQTALNVTSNYSEAISKKENIVLLYIAVPQFDKIMNSKTPDELFEKLKKQVALISEIIINADGDIDKIMGEKLLIAFHLNNKSLKEVSINAVRIAHLIATNVNLCFNVAIGVNYGQVISGYLGVGEKRDFTIIGDPVNVTARIESVAEKLEKNRCLISESLYDQINEQIDAKLYGEVELKGKSEPMKVYQLF